MMLRKKKIILTKDKMMQMNVNHHSKQTQSKLSESLAALTMTEPLKMIETESQTTETTLEIAQGVESKIRKTKKQLKKRAQKQRKKAKLGEEIQSSQPSFGATGNNLCVEEIPLECLNCFRVEKRLRRCKGCW